MATNKQRRDAERQRLQRQLQDRRRREAGRRRATLIGSVAGSLVLVAAIVVVIVIATSGGGSTPAAGKQGTGAPSGGASSAGATTSAPAAATGPLQAGKPCASAGKPGVVTFQGVSVGNPTNLKKQPKVCSSASKRPSGLETKDLVVGHGKAASPSATVTVQYSGVLYSNGTEFDSSWSRGQPASFSLQQVVPGFTQGIGGHGKTPPMKVGGRRIMILPASLGYGASAPAGSGIPANAPLVFVVDLLKVTG